MIPGPFELWRDTFTLRRSASHVTSRSALGLIRSAVTDAEVTAVSYWSRAEASSARQGVSRVQARSVLPGEYDEHSVCMACCLPRVTAEASVMRRWAREPSGSAAGSSGALRGPPDRHRGVGQQERQHDRVGVLDHLATQPDQGGLAGPAGEGADLGVDVGGSAGVAEDDAERARGMLVGGHPGRGHRLVGVLLVDDHDQGQHHAHGRAAGLEAVLDERRGDRGRGGVGQLDHSGSLRRRERKERSGGASGFVG